MIGWEGRTCAWCEGPIGDDGPEWCSDVCEKIVTGTHWPHQSGPVTHDEILGWIEEQEAIDALGAERQAALAAKVR